MKRKVIIIAYYFFPNKEVGANRMRFWASYLNNNFPDIEPVVITATPFSEQEKIVNEQYLVEPKHWSLLGLLIKDEGVNWSEPLVQFFKKNRFENVMGILMTGGPFMQFSVIPDLQALYSCKVAIDFRDPFANNHRFDNSSVRIWLKQFFERKFVKNADAVITVNKDYLKTLTGFTETQNKFHIIPNGYDDESIDNARKKVPQIKQAKDNLELILTGKCYNNAGPLATLEAIKELRDEGISFSYNHFGSYEPEVELVEENSYI